MVWAIPLKRPSSHGVISIGVGDVQCMLKCKLDSTNGGTFSNSAEQVILIFFLFQRALVMSKF